MRLVFDVIFGVSWVLILLCTGGEFIWLKLKKVTGVDHTQKYDMFLTHEWSKDKSNHVRVSRLNEKLKRENFSTWFDEDRMEGNIVDAMCNGIDNSKIVLIFVTQRYIDKVGCCQTDNNPNPNPDDNCKREFEYAHRKKTSKLMISILMEEEAKDTSKWSGPVGMNLGSHKYIDMSTDENMDSHFVALVDLVKKTIKESKNLTTTFDAGHQS